MKNLSRISLVLFTSIGLAACGATGEKAKKEEEPTTNQTVEENVDEEVVAVNATTTTADPRLQEPDENTVCEMCNMKVYEKSHDMGMFSAQAIKADGSVAFYDDIGCLLNAEVAKNEVNEKFVRDFNTLEWAPVEDVTIVKTELKTPMNWGYAYFIEKADAEKYISENEGAYIAELATIKEEAKARYEKKMKKQAKQDNETSENGMQHEHNDEHGHNH